MSRRNRSSKAENRPTGQEKSSARNLETTGTHHAVKEPFMFDPDERMDTSDSDNLPDLLDLLHPSSIADQPVTPETRGMTPIFNVLRDEKDDRFVLQIDGVIYRSLVDEPKVRRKFLAIVKELSEVVNKPYEPPVEDEEEIPGLEDRYASISNVPPQEPPSTMQPTPKPAADTTDTPASGSETPGSLPTYNFEDSSTLKQGRFGRPKYEPKPIPELNIAEAIEAFLQYKLAQTPTYAGRDIHVHNAPGGFVRIQVDDRYYDEVGQVEDEEIRTFLSSTIQEWQKNQQR
jgi:hypothetical protein